MPGRVSQVPGFGTWESTPRASRRFPCAQSVSPPRPSLPAAPREQVASRPWWRAPFAEPGATLPRPGPPRRILMAATLSVVRPHRIVSHAEWIEARKQFLAKEKEFTRLRDELSRQRRELPRERVEKSYVFEGPRG